MRFTWFQILAFFAALLAVGWVIFPDHFFFGLILRQNPDRTVAIQSLKSYLAKHPHRKNASLELAKAYESIGDPESAIRTMETLYERRRGDWEIGSMTLEVIERSGYWKKMIQFRWKLYHDLKGKPWAKPPLLMNLLYQNYQLALLHQDEKEELRSLEALYKESENPGSFRYQLLRYHMTKGNFQNALQLIENELSRDPSNLDMRLALVSVYRLQGQNKMALSMTKQALLSHPNEPRILEQRVALFELDKKYLQTLPDLKLLVKSRPGNLPLKKKLAHNTLVSGQFEEAMGLYEEIIEKTPKESSAWLEMIYAYVKQGRNKEAIEWLERYLKRFPADLEALDLLVHLFELEKNEAGAISILMNHWEHHPKDYRRAVQLAGFLMKKDRFPEAEQIYQKFIALYPKNKKIWWDLIYGYVDRKMNRQAISQLQGFLIQFPGADEGIDLLVYLYTLENEKEEAISLLESLIEGDSFNKKWGVQLIELYLDTGQLENAEKSARRMHQKDPKDPIWLVKLARVQLALKRHKEAIATYRTWLQIDGKDPSILKEFGLELFYAGNFKEARKILSKAFKSLPTDGELIFAFSETEFELGNSRSGRQLAGQALENLYPDDHMENTRMRLKIQSRLRWDEELRGAYRTAVSRFPKNFQILNDFIDGLIEHKHFNEAEKLLKEIPYRFPKQEKLYHRVLFDMLYSQEKWVEAIAVMKTWIHREENNYDLYRDLAEAYRKNGEWQEAGKLLQNIPQGEGDPYKIGETLREFHDRYDHHLAPHFLSRKLSSEEILETGLDYRGYLKEDIQLKALLRNGHYKVPQKNFSDSVMSATAQAIYEKFLPFKFSLLFGNSSGGVEDSFWISPLISYDREGHFFFEASYQNNRFWNDFSEAVAAGGQADITRLSARKQMFPQLSMSAQMLLAQYEITGGHQADRIEIAPEISYTLLNEPYLALGYQFLYDDVDGSSLFFDQVSLIRRSRAHTVYVSYSLWLKANDLQLNTYLYNSEETERNLNFLNGDLLGLAVNVQWRVLRWLNVRLGYEYGRETATGVSGESQTWTVKLEGHWYSHGKKNISD